MRAAVEEATAAACAVERARDRLDRWQAAAPPRVRRGDVWGEEGSSVDVDAADRSGTDRIPLCALLRSRLEQCVSTVRVNDAVSDEPSRENGQPAVGSFLPAFPIGARVERGPDWIYGVQDGGRGSKGTVVMADPATDQWVRVRWDNGSINRYCTSDAMRHVVLASADESRPASPTGIYSLLNLVSCARPEPATSTVQGVAIGCTELIGGLLQSPRVLKYPPPRDGSPPFEIFHYQIRLQSCFPLTFLPDNAVQYILTQLPGRQIANAAQLCRSLRRNAAEAIRFRLAHLGQPLPPLYEGEPPCAALQFTDACCAHGSQPRTVSGNVNVSLHADAMGRVFFWGNLSEPWEFTDAQAPDMPEASRVPRLVAGLQGVSVREVAAGPHHLLALSSTGQAYSWGKGGDGALGLGDVLNRAQPTLIKALADYRVLSADAGESFSLVLLASGRLMSFGSGPAVGVGQCCASKATKITQPARVWVSWTQAHALEGVIHISAGPKRALAVTSSGELFSWGVGSYGTLGHGEAKSTVTEPRRIQLTLEQTAATYEGRHLPSTPHFLMASAGESHSLALSTQRQPYGWGYHCYKQLPCVRKRHDLYRPTLLSMPSGVTVRSLAAGEDFSVFLTAYGRVYICGGGRYFGRHNTGLLGIEDEDEPGDGRGSHGRSTPALVGTLAGFHIEEVATGSEHTIARATEGQVFTFGSPGTRLGQDPSAPTSKVPVQVAIAV